MYCVYYRRDIPPSEIPHRCNSSSDPRETRNPNYSSYTEKSKGTRVVDESFDSGRRSLPKKTFK